MIGGERPALVEPSETLEGVLEEGMKLIMSHCLPSIWRCRVGYVFPFSLMFCIAICGWNDNASRMLIDASHDTADPDWIRQCLGVSFTDSGFRGEIMIHLRAHTGRLRG